MAENMALVSGLLVSNRWEEAIGYFTTFSEWFVCSKSIVVKRNDYCSTISSFSEAFSESTFCQYRKLLSCGRQISIEEGEDFL